MHRIWQPWHWVHPSLESIFQKGVSSMQHQNCSLLGPLCGIHFIVLSAPPLASQVKSPYPSQYIATLFEKTTLACWFARQVQMLRWGKLAWFSGLLSRWNSKTRLQHTATSLQSWSSSEAVHHLATNVALPTASSAGRTFWRQCFWIYWCWNADASSLKEGCANGVEWQIAYGFLCRQNFLAAVLLNLLMLKCGCFKPQGRLC